MNTPNGGDALGGSGGRRPGRVRGGQRSYAPAGLLRKSALATVLLLAGVVLLLVAVIALFLASSTVRRPVVDRILRATAAALPGHVTWSAARWDEAGTLILEDVLWIASSEPGVGTVEDRRAERRADPGDEASRRAEGHEASLSADAADDASRKADAGHDARATVAVAADTLAAVDRILLRVDVRALLARRIHVREVSVEAVVADVPGIQAVLATRPARAATPSSGEPETLPYFEPSVIPGAPALLLDRLALTLARVHLGDGRTLRGAAELAVDLSRVNGGRIALGPLDLVLDGVRDRAEAPVGAHPRTGPGHEAAGGIAERSGASGTAPARDDSLAAVARPVRGDSLADVRRIHLEGALAVVLASGEAEGALDLTVDEVWSARLSVAPRASGVLRLRFADQLGDHLVVADRPSTAPGDSVVLAADLRFQRDGLALRSVALDGSLHVPALRELFRRPFLPELGGVAEVGAFAVPLDAVLDVAWIAGPHAVLEAEIDFLPNAILTEARVAGRTTVGGWRVDELTFASRDARIEGWAQVSGGAVDAMADSAAVATVASSTASVEASIDVRLDGPDFLEPWVAQVPPVEVLVADLSLRANGPLRAPRLVLRADGRARVSGSDVAFHGLDAETPRWGMEPLAVVVELTTSGLAAGIGAALDPDLRGAQLAPIHLRAVEAGRAGPSRRGAVLRPTPPSSGPATPTAPGGRVDWTDGVFLRDVGIDGDFGRAVVSGDVDGAGNVAFTAVATWSEVPPVLLSRLGRRPGLADSLRRSWRAHGPFRLDAELRAVAEPPRVGLEAALTLPGPAALAPLLPPGARVGELGPLVAQLAAEGRAWDDLAIRLSGSGVDWLDRLDASVHRRGDAVVVDSLGVELLGIAVAADGALGAAPELRGTFQLDSLDRIAALLPTLPESLRATAVGTFRFADGSAPSGPGGAAPGAPSGATNAPPELDLTARGAFVLGTLFVPRYDLTIRRDSDPLRARLELPAGLRSTGLDLDHAEISAAAASDSLFPLTVAARVTSPDLDGTIGGVLTQVRGAWGLVVDSLRVGALDRELVSRQPFRFELDPGRRRVEVRGLDLGGNIGTLVADGFVEVGDAELDIEAALDLPPRPIFVAIPPEAWPVRLEAEVRARGPELWAAVRAEGIPLEAGRSADLSLGARSVAEGVRLQGAILAGTDSLLRAEGLLPATVQLYPPALHFGDGGLSLGLRAQRLPLPVPSPRDPERRERLVLDAEVDLSGTTAHPVLRAEFLGGFPDWTELADFILVGSASYAPAAGLSSRETPLGLRVALFRGDARGAVDSLRGGWSEDLANSGTVQRGDATSFADSLLVGRVELPIRLSLRPWALDLPPEDELKARVTATGLDLTEFAPLFPPNLSASGSLDLDLIATGAVRDPDVAGSLLARRLEGRLADGSRVSADGRLSLSGTARRPNVRGNVGVNGGVLVIPETTRALLPTSGTARLWDVAATGDSLEAATANTTSPDVPPHDAPLADVMSPDIPQGGPASAGDSTSSGADSTRVTAPDSTVAFHPDLDVTVDIPGAVWIRGRGLEVELAGNVQVTYANAPVLTGTLEARTGHLRLLGRYFEVESGIVGFYGEEELDPRLDLALTSRVDATVVTVEVTGTAKKPDLRLSSDPEMEEGDILSLLVLGRPLDQLDDDQTDLLERRARDLAVGFGATRLGETLSGELGVDLVSVQPTSQGTGSALVIGKYLSPRILLQYEQAIQSTEDFLVNLEYLLTRSLRVETFYGRQSQSGAELNWISEY